MAGKIFRGAEGKLRRQGAVNGKLLRDNSVACGCCNQTPITHCQGFPQSLCLASGATGYDNAPSRIKVTVAGTTPRVGCDADFGVELTVGNVNREFYVSLYKNKSGEFTTYYGTFLDGARTDAVNALEYLYLGNPYGNCPAIYPGYWYSVVVSLTKPGVITTTQKAYVAISPFAGVTSSPLIAATGYYPEFDPVLGVWTDRGVDVTDFCGGVNVASNISTFGPHNVLSTGGTITVTACPDCPQACSAPSCISIARTGCLSAAAAYTDGDYTYLTRHATVTALALNFNTGQWGQPQATPPVGPCAWHWRKLANFGGTASGYVNFYLWYDGVDWQGLLTKGTSSGNLDQATGEAVIARTKYAGAITCTPPGQLGGTITLEPSWHDWPYPGDGENCTFTVTIPCSVACPTDCSSCTTPTNAIVSGFAAAGCVGTACPDMNTTIPLTRSGCNWDETSGPIFSLRCVLGVWTATLGVVDCGAFSATWTANASGSCPPLTGWTYTGSTAECGTGVLTLS